MLGFRLSTFILTSFLLSSIAQGQSMSHMRAQRYCEVVLSYQPLEFIVYNTIGLNNCPENQWQTLSAARVEKETGARFVLLNGPRYFMMDGFKNTSLINKQKRSFNGLMMREAGLLHLNLTDILMRKPYVTHEVGRHTTWVYDAGKPIYELIDDKGQVFVLQSYSIQVEQQTIQSLSTLGQKLKLPQGWSFKTGLAKKRVEVVAVHDKAIVIQDDYENTYQLAERDFL